jgi:hypothetical protein
LQLSGLWQIESADCSRSAGGCDALSSAPPDPTTWVSIVRLQWTPTGRCSRPPGRAPSHVCGVTVRSSSIGHHPRFGAHIRAHPRISARIRSTLTALRSATLVGKPSNSRLRPLFSFRPYKQEVTGSSPVPPIRKMSRVAATSGLRRRILVSLTPLTTGLWCPLVPITGRAVPERSRFVPTRLHLMYFCDAQPAADLRWAARGNRRGDPQSWRVDWRAIA